MRYNKWSQERLGLGKKSLTSRTESHTSDPEVLDVVGPLPWGFIRDFLWRDEGADSPEELQRVINSIFRRKVSDERLFFVHVIDPQKALEEAENSA